MHLLAISEYGTRTGAPIALRSFLRWASENTDWRCTALFGSGGAIAADLASGIDRVVIDPLAWRRVERLSGRLSTTLRDQARHLHHRDLVRRVGRPDVVLVNTVAAGKLATPFLEGAAPVVVYVHELDDMVGMHRDSTAILLERGRQFIAVSRAVREMLVERLGVQADRVTTILGSPEREALAPHDPSAAQAVRRAFGIPDDAFLVGGFGWVGSVKGTDRFVRVARLASTAWRSGPLRFVWVGGATVAARARASTAIVHAGLEDTVSLVPPTDSVYPYYGACDVVLVTSREEPLSLVAMEAAAAGCPVLCFADSAGPMELAENGVTAPFRDEEAMAAELVRLAEEPAERLLLGQRGADAVRRHHHPDSTPAAVAAVIEAVAAGR
ncbi:MAG: glycosyltransferase family 4 protein [Acidimicrobiales bacterium]